MKNNSLKKSDIKKKVLAGGLAAFLTLNPFIRVSAEGEQENVNKRDIEYVPSYNNESTHPDIIKYRGENVEQQNEETTLLGVVEKAGIVVLNQGLKDELAKNNVEVLKQLNHYNCTISLNTVSDMMRREFNYGENNDNYKEYPDVGGFFYSIIGEDGANKYLDPIEKYQSVLSSIQVQDTVEPNRSKKINEACQYVLPNASRQEEHKGYIEGIMKNPKDSNEFETVLFSLDTMFASSPKKGTPLDQLKENDDMMGARGVKLVIKVEDSEVVYATSQVVEVYAGWFYEKGKLTKGVKELPKVIGEPVIIKEQQKQVINLDEEIDVILPGETVDFETYEEKSQPEYEYQEEYENLKNVDKEELPVDIDNIEIIDISN